MGGMFLRKFCQGTVALLFTLSFLCAEGAEVSLKRMVVKADDVTSAAPKWERFFQLSAEHGVKVTAGIIGQSLKNPSKAYADWILQWKNRGSVEFWNHGWDHKRWEENGKKLSEFGGSGYEHQKSHLTQTQEAGAKALDFTFTTFGSPFNALDQDSAKALLEIPDLKRVFIHPKHPMIPLMKGKIILPMNFVGEQDGVGKPNFQKFKESYEKKKDVTFSALQFHPNLFSEEGFTEYASILKFLKQEGWTFVFSEEIQNQP